MDTFNYYEIFLLIFDIITTFSFTWYFYWKAFYMQHHASLRRAYTISTGSISMLLRGGHCSISYTFSISLGYHSFLCIFFFFLLLLLFPGLPLFSSFSFPSSFFFSFLPFSVPHVFPTTPTVRHCVYSSRVGQKPSYLPSVWSSVLNFK